MPDTDLHQPDLGPLRAAAEAAELAQAVSGLVSVDGYRLADSDPLAPLARDIARSMTEAGLTVHHCARHDPRYRLGGVCLLPVPADRGRPRRDRGVLDHAQPAAAGLGPVRHLHRHPAGHEHGHRRHPARLRVPAAPFGSGGAWLVTGRRDQDPGAGR